jgi:hypothetical protein
MDKTNMESLLFHKLIQEILLKNKDAIVLPFWRGESCLHPEFRDLMNFALDNGIRVHLSTNGHFMSKDFMKIFYRCEFITFSLHTDTGFKNAQKLINTKPSWSKATIQGSFVDSETSVGKYLKQCTQDTNLKGFDSIRLYEEHTVDGKFGKSAESDHSSNRFFCPKLRDTFVVSSDGSFSRCNHIWKPEKDYNLNHSSIEEVWKSPVMSKIRNNYPDTKCAPCDQWSGHTNGQAWQKNPHGTIIHKIFGGQGL